MMWLRGCPRCGGDLALESFGADTYVTCLQCGAILTAQQEARLRLAGQRARVTGIAA